MDKDTIKSIVLKNQERIPQIPLVRRDVRFEPSGSYVLVGLRRAGKSYMLYQHIQQRIADGLSSREDILYINFEDDRLGITKMNQLDSIIQSYEELYQGRRPVVYLDEIQNVEGWEKFVRRLADTGYQVMVTGSNAKMLSREIATTLGGRFIVRNVYPFSFAEYLRYKGIQLGQHWQLDGQRTQVRALFTDYFQYGGFAETFDRIDKQEWLNWLCQKIVLGDIVARNDIRSGGMIRLLTRKLAESVMQPMTLMRLTNILKSTGERVSRNTVSDYLGYMNEAFMTFRLTNYTDSFSERVTNCKHYFCDNGLLNNYLIDPLSRLLENLVAITLMKRFGGQEEDNLYYYNKSVEVDFYVPGEGLAIQVSYSLRDFSTRQRETEALVKMSRAFRLQRMMIITMDEEEIINAGRAEIEVIPVWKWLLGMS
ncbi:MAG: ATP-binding protein [Bacteroidaceae bacterium]|nr:ATP-binding protein [Bacteroidaceae bacterium]